MVSQQELTVHTLRQDLPELLDRLIPPSTSYGHEQTWHDGNGHSHLQTTLLGSALTVPVRGGRLLLGTWQQIFHLECDVRPRERTVVVTVMGAQRVQGVGLARLAGPVRRGVSDLHPGSAPSVAISSMAFGAFFPCG